MKKQPFKILLACILGAVLLASGCGSDAGGKATESAASNTAKYASFDMKSEDPAEQGVMQEEDFEAADGGAAPSDTAKEDAANPQGEKIIYTYDYSVETKAFDTFTKKVAEKTVQLNGYVELSETTGSASAGLNRYANMTLRIPAEKMDQLLALLDSESNVTRSSRSSENVTLQYVDLESHIKALRTEQKTLLRLIEKADKLEDVIALQSQLTQVRYEIESYESSLRMYDNRIDYSTMYLSISEVERTTTVTSAQTSFVEEVKNKFSDNLYAVGQWLRWIAIWLLSSLPILVPLALAIVAVLVIIRKWNRRWKKNRPAHNRNLPEGYRSIYQRNICQKKSASQKADAQDPDGQDETVQDKTQPPNA